MRQNVAVVIVNYRTPALTLRCLEAVRAERQTLGGSVQAVVVEGGSRDGSAEALRVGLTDERYDGWVSLLPLEINGGFGWANNQALLRLIQSDDAPAFVHLLNPDTVIELGAIAELAATLAEHPGCAAAGSQLIDDEGQPAGSAFRFPSIGREFVGASQTAALGRLIGIAPTLVTPGTGGEVDWVTGASVMLRTEALRATGLFDDGFFLYFEEIELMHRLRRAGWTVRHVPESRVYHVGGAATGVNGHDPRQVARRPAYWYQSRRRYFALTSGARGAAAASMAWLAGRTLLAPRRLLAPGRSRVEVPFERQDLVGHGIWPSIEDMTPHAPDWRSPVGVPPAWMRSSPA